MSYVVHNGMMVDQKKKPKDLKETKNEVAGATETPEKENPTDIGPGITERYEDA